MTGHKDSPPIEQPQDRMDTRLQWREAEQAGKRARASSAPGQHKNAPDILRFLWKLMRVSWEKGIKSNAWHRSGGVLILIEKSMDISQFRPICLLNVEGKIFFSVIAQRMSTYLQRNNLDDTSVQQQACQGFLDALNTPA